MMRTKKRKVTAGKTYRSTDLVLIAIIVRFEIIVVLVVLTVVDIIIQIIVALSFSLK
jgi:hypothetical protein